MARVEGKVAIITGGTGGMGVSHSRKLISEGAKVVITDIDEKKGNTLAAELGENALFIKHDVSSEEDWKKVVDQTEEKFGPVNILVNNAGITIKKSIEDFTLAEYKKVIDVNQVVIFLGMKTAVKSMKKVKSGSIINISSLNGLVGSSDQIAYDSSKFAVRGMTKSAAAEFADYGIRVNSIHPGLVDTPILHTEGVQEAIKGMVNAIPMKRVARPEEVSNLVLYLASDEASYTTASEYVIDGGFMGVLS